MKRDIHMYATQQRFKDGSQVKVLCGKSFVRGAIWKSWEPNQFTPGSKLTDTSGVCRECLKVVVPQEGIEFLYGIVNGDLLPEYLRSEG